MLQPGTVLLDKYRIESVIGRGGMGVVARAHHIHLDQPVAIKCLLPEALEDPTLVERFVREARAAVKLKSEHVSRVFDVGQLDDGAPYIVMEYLEGTDLRRLLRQHGRLAPGMAVDLMLQACEALAEAHAYGIVHRDVKPSNFFVTQAADGSPLLKVLDFGVSKLPVDLELGSTHSQALMGTPSYMSPEQMQSSKRADPRADLWGLGVVLYELLTGERPFQADNFPLLCVLVATAPPLPIEVPLPRGLEAAVLRCLEKDPAQRFASMAELAAALAPYAQSSMQAARSTERTARVLARQSQAVAVPALPPSGEHEPLTTLRSSAGESVRARLAGSVDMTMPGKRTARASASVAEVRPTAAAAAVASARRRSWLLFAGGVALVALAVLIGFQATRAALDPEAFEPAPPEMPAASPVQVRPGADPAATAASDVAASDMAASDAAASDAGVGPTGAAPAQVATSGAEPASPQPAAVRRTERARNRLKRRAPAQRTGKSAGNSAGNVDDESIFGTRQ